MAKNNLRYYFWVIFTFLLLSSPIVVIKAQDNEIKNVISRVSVDNQKDAILDYTYQMKIFFQRHKIGGKRFTRLYEAILPSHYASKKLLTHPLILIEDSERPITETQIRNSREFIANQILRTEAESDDGLPESTKAPEHGGYWTIGFSTNNTQIGVNILQLLNNAKLTDFQRTSENDQKIISIDFSPDPAAKLPKSLSYLSKIEGRLFIDEKDQRIIAVEGYPIGELSNLKNKPEAERRQQSVFLFLQKKVAEFWFPLMVKLNFKKHPEIFEEIELKFDFKDYKKNVVDIEFIKDSQEVKNKKGTTKDQ